MKYFDISRPISQSSQLTAFGLPLSNFKKHYSLNHGDSVECWGIEICPHVHATHTECARHIQNTNKSVPANILEILPPPLMTGKLITLTPKRFVNCDHEEYMAYKRDGVPITLSDVVHSLQSVKNAWEDSIVECCIIRTIGINLANQDFSHFKHSYSDIDQTSHVTNMPPYLTKSAVEYLRNCGVQHLFVEMPSIDRMNDGGHLLAHHYFFGIDETKVCERTVTELCQIPKDVQDGLYWVNLQIIGTEMDCALSRPVLIPMSELQLNKVKS